MHFEVLLYSQKILTGKQFGLPKQKRILRSDITNKTYIQYTFCDNSAFTGSFSIWLEC